MAVLWTSYPEVCMEGSERYPEALTEKQRVRFEGCVSRLARRYHVRNPTVDEQDLVQEGWMAGLIALRNPRRDPARNPYAYAFRAAQRAMLRFTLRNKTQVSLPKMVCRDTADAFYAATQSFSLDDVEDVDGAMPRAQRALFGTKRYAGLDVDAHVPQIGDVLVSSPATGNVLVTRVREIIAQDPDAEVAKLVLLDGWTPQVVARLRAVPPQAVLDTVRRVKHAIWDDGPTESISV